MRRLFCTCAFALAGAALAASLGCSRPHTVKAALPPPPPLNHAQNQIPAQPPRLSQEETSLRRIGGEMELLISQPRFSIPDALLNRTACLVVFSGDGSSARRIEGFASCRNSHNQWTSPVIVNLEPLAEIRLPSDLYMFVLSRRARQRLVAGRLTLGPELRVAAGPSGKDGGMLDEVRVSRDVFAYRFEDDALRGVPAPRAAIVLDADKTQRLYGHPLLTSQLLDNGTMSSTVSSFYSIDVGSFFNTITPAGIIIHHSVLIPAGDLPEAERTLDRFHYARGYEVSCFGKVYHIAYHFLILPDGSVVSGRPERCEGAHARGYNSYLGIALVGDFSSHLRSGRRGAAARPTKAQLATLVRLCCYLRRKYSIPLQRIMPHNAVSRTACPGDGLDFAKVLAAISRDSGAGS